MIQHQGTGFVLRTWPLRDSDLIANVFTLEHGKIRGVAHGALRPKSPWAGALEPLTEIALTWRAREGEELSTLSGPTILHSPYHEAPDLARSWTLAFVAELADETAHDVDEVLYRLLRSVVGAIAAGAPTAVAARYAAAWVLRLHGVLPDLDTCAGCGRDIREDGGIWHWSVHGVGCGTCLPPEGTSGPVVLPDDLRFLEEVRRRAPGDVALPSPQVLRRTGAFLRALLHELVGKPLRSERFLDEIEA